MKPYHVTFTDPYTGERVQRPMTAVERKWCDEREPHPFWWGKGFPWLTGSGPFSEHVDTGNGCGWLPDLFPIYERDSADMLCVDDPVPYLEQLRRRKALEVVE